MAKKQQQIGSFLKRHAVGIVKNGATFGLAGSDTVDRLKKVADHLNRKRVVRVETFSQAVERQGLTEADIQRRQGEIKAAADLVLLMSILFLSLTVIGTIRDWSFMLVSLFWVGSIWTVCEALVWRFRFDQVRHRELFGFKDWLRGRRTGEFK